MAQQQGRGKNLDPLCHTMPAEQAQQDMISIERQRTSLI